ncbi:MAG: sulfite exporter TauE/SafE family protein [Ferruginibacter sp.]|nr:sulfite exporter TauE/SafE family protein [Ferruginibacter sp.]
MDIQTILIVILIGIAAGMLSGLVGVGGGLIIVPALVYFLGMSQHSAQGTSLGLILLPVGIFAVLNYYKQGHIDIKIVWLLAIGFVAGSFWGSRISLSLSQETVKKFFAILMILVAVKMLFFDKKKETSATARIGLQKNS